MSNCSADPELLDLLITSLQKLQGNVTSSAVGVQSSDTNKQRSRRGAKKPTNAGIEGQEVDSTDINSVLNAILRAVTAVLDQHSREREAQESRLNQMESKIQAQRDWTDEVQQ